jgi:hypothetical protein
MVLVNNNNKSPGGHRSWLWLLGVGAGWLWLGVGTPDARAAGFGERTRPGHHRRAEPEPEWAGVAQHTFSGHARHRPAGAGAATARAIRSRGAAVRHAPAPLRSTHLSRAAPSPCDRCAPLPPQLSCPLTRLLATCWAERKRRERRVPPTTTSSLPSAFGVAGPLSSFLPSTTANNNGRPVVLTRVTSSCVDGRTDGTTGGLHSSTLDDGRTCGLSSACTQPAVHAPS